MVLDKNSKDSIVNENNFISKPRRAIQRYIQCTDFAGNGRFSCQKVVQWWHHNKGDKKRA